MMRRRNRISWEQVVVIIRTLTLFVIALTGLITACAQLIAAIFQ
jgi:hypothetical protein